MAFLPMTKSGGGMELSSAGETTILTTSKTTRTVLNSKKVSDIAYVIVTYSFNSGNTAVWAIYKQDNGSFVWDSGRNDLVITKESDTSIGVKVTSADRACALMYIFKS